MAQAPAAARQERSLPQRIAPMVSSTRVTRSRDGVFSGMLMVGEIAALRAEEKAAGFHWLPEQLFGGQCVEQRLKNRAAADILRTVLRRFAGFVIGDAQGIARWHASRSSRWSRAGGCRSEWWLRRLVLCRIAVVARRQGRRRIRNAAAANRAGPLPLAVSSRAGRCGRILDFAFPDALDGRRKVVFELQPPRDRAPGRRDPALRASVAGVMGSRPGFLQLAKQLELNGMEQRAAGERVHLFERYGSFARAELKDAVQQEAIGTGGEMLQRGGRVAALGEAVRFENLRESRDRDPPSRRLQVQRLRQRRPRVRSDRARLSLTSIK